MLIFQYSAPVSHTTKVGSDTCSHVLSLPAFSISGSIGRKAHTQLEMMLALFEAHVAEERLRCMMLELHLPTPKYAIATTERMQLFVQRNL